MSFDLIGRHSIPRDLPSRATARPSQSPSHSRAFGGGRVRPPSSVVPGHARPDPRRTVANRIGKRVGETLKSSNLLSSASALTRKDRKRRYPQHRSPGSPVSISLSGTAPGPPSARAARRCAMASSRSARASTQLWVRPMSKIGRMTASASRRTGTRPVFANASLLEQ